MASWWQKTVAAAASLAGLAGGAYYMLMRRPLPRKKGEVYLKGLRGPVEVKPQPGWSRPSLRRLQIQHSANVALPATGLRVPMPGCGRYE